MEKKHFIYSCAILFFLAVFSAVCVTLYTNIREVDNLRRTNDSIRTELTRATETNRELAEQLARCEYIVSDLDGLVSSNLRTVRDAIDLIEEIRVQVQSLEMELSNWDSDEYYNYWDSVYGLE